MTESVHAGLRARLLGFDSAREDYAVCFVRELLNATRAAGASDLHLQPGPSGLDVRWRLDGVLHSLGEFAPGSSTDIVTRLKVLADLLTYRTDVPQEGRLRTEEDSDIEMRVSTFPTLHGERAVVRLFASQHGLDYLSDLCLPDSSADALRDSLQQTSGAVLITGPGGSGKTTTAYACLREIIRGSEGRRSVLTLEDPIENALPGAAQAHVGRNPQFNLARALRSALRQDPEVLFVGEIRDRETAEGALQASLTGHLVLSTFHAGGAAAAVCRLLDMSIEPYALRSGVRVVVSQRLVRRLCDCCTPLSGPETLWGEELPDSCRPTGCPRCQGTGYRGRQVLAELLPLFHQSLASTVLRHPDADSLQQQAVREGMIPLHHQALVAVRSSVTSAEEVRRVFGVVAPSGPKS